MEHLKITRIVKIIIVLILCAAMMIMCVSPGFAVVGTATVVASAVVAAMSAFGVGTLVSGMSVSQVTEWVSSELASWASSLGDTVANLLPVASIAVNPLGALTLMPATAARIVTFVRWLTSKYNVSAGGASVQVFSSTFGNGQPFQGEQKFNLVTFNGNYLFQLYPRHESRFNSYYVFAYDYSGGNLYLCSCLSGNKSAVVRYYKTDTQGSGNFDSSTYSSSYDISYALYALPCSSYTLHVPYYNSLADGLWSLKQYLGGNAPSLSLVPEGAIDYPDYVGNDDQELPYVVDWGGSPGMTLDDAAQGIMDKVADNDLVSDGSIAIDPDNAMWPDIVSPETVPTLDEIFPFCIPFDIYHFFQALVAMPEAPRFEVPFVVPGLVNYTFVIDLSSFGTVAQVFRTMELLCFCVGLALITRRLIRG